MVATTSSDAVASRPVPGSVAVIVVVPSSTAVASPSLPPALLTVATPGDEELQVTASVRSWLDASLTFPSP